MNSNYVLLEIIPKEPLTANTIVLVDGPVIYNNISETKLKQIPENRERLFKHNILFKFSGV